MPFCAVITRDVEARYRGFLGSVMLELSPGTYAHPRMSAGVRERIWSVLEDWHGVLDRGSIVMTWADRSADGAMGLNVLGEPAKDVVAHEGVLLVRRALSEEATRRLASADQDPGSLTGE